MIKSIVKIPRLRQIHHKSFDNVIIRAADDPSVSQSVFTITEKAPTRAFSWLKTHTSTFTFKTLFRHYAKWANQPAVPYDFCIVFLPCGVNVCLA